MPIFDPSRIGTDDNIIYFNEDGTDPYYRLKSRLPERRQIREFDAPLPEGSGVADFQTLIGKTYYILQGTMYPNDEITFDEGKKALRKLASLEVGQADAGSDQGYVPYKWYEADDINKQLWVKVEYVDIPEKTRSGLKLDFKLYCKIKYPVIFAQDNTSAIIGDSNATASGTSYLPWVLPMIIGKSSYTSNGSVYNAGDLETYPSITINGPINRPKLTNTTSGEYIEVDVNLATTGDSLIIIYDQDTVSIAQAGISKFNKLTSGSTLFKIKPGTNDFTLTGSTVGSGAYASLSFNAAWPLS